MNAVQKCDSIFFGVICEKKLMIFEFKTPKSLRFYQLSIYHLFFLYRL
jgi:hypothetical protein